MENRTSSAITGISSLHITDGPVGKDDVVPVGFDEAVLRALCDMDVRYIPFPWGSLSDYSVWTPSTRRQDKTGDCFMQGKSQVTITHRS
jgi:hypothetical protein